jgi:hypothetical protein
MTTKTLDTKALGKIALALSLGIAVLGLSFAQATNAQAFWWWGAGYAHGQETDDDDTVTVTIKKYIDGEVATAGSADSLSFPMAATWNDPEGAGEGSGNYTLSPSTTPSYQAKTSELNEGASYSTHEVLDAANVGASCTLGGKPFALVGYSVGASLELAKDATVSSTSPSFTNLTQDKVVIVWNETCDDNATTTPGGSSGEISGQVTGGQNGEDPGDLEVTSIEAQKTTATANGEFADGWRYVFNVTVPTDEPNLAMKFADWVDEDDASHTIPVANNMRISSAQANASSTVLLTAANTYSSPDLHMTGDLDDEEEGLQVKVVVEVAVPTSTFNGNYSTTYGVRTLE